MTRAASLIVLLSISAVTATELVAQRSGGRGRGGRGDAIGARPARGGELSATASRIERRSYLFTEAGEQMEYFIFVSSKVKPDTKAPLIIALHGLGMPPDQLLRRITDHAEREGYIVAAPVGYNLTGWYGANGPGRGGRNIGDLSEKDVMNVLERMRGEFLIDERRIYLLGQSMGGAGALYLGIKHRDIWAAVGASAPAVRTELHSPAELEQATAQPFILVHGDADPAVPVSISREWAAKMKALGMTYEYRELRGVGHDALTPGAEHILRFFNRHTKPGR